MVNSTASNRDSDLCLILCVHDVRWTTDCSGRKYFSDVIVGGACWNWAASSASSSSVRKGLIVWGLMARERVREKPDQSWAGCEGRVTGGSRWSGGERETERERERETERERERERERGEVKVCVRCHT